MPEVMHDTGNRPTILLNPGPVTMSNRVRKVFLKEDLCHREPEFAEMVLDIKHGFGGCIRKQRQSTKRCSLPGPELAP
jgi:aspartate aminotransferase-like enzyme